MEDMSILKEYYDIAKLCQEQSKSVAAEPSNVLTTGSVTFPTTTRESPCIRTDSVRFANSGDLFSETQDIIDSDTESNSTASSLLYYLLDTKPMRYAKLKEKYKNITSRACSLLNEQQNKSGEKQESNRSSGRHANCSDYLPSEKSNADGFVGGREDRREGNENTLGEAVQRQCSDIEEGDCLLDIYVNRKINLLEKVAILDCIGKKSFDSDMESADGFDTSYANCEIVTDENAPMLDNSHYGSTDQEGLVNSDTESCLNNVNPSCFGENQNCDEDTKLCIATDNDLNTSEANENRELKSKISKYLSTLPDDDSSPENDTTVDTETTKCIVGSDAASSGVPDTTVMTGQTADCSDSGEQSLDLIKSGLSLIKENLQSDKFSATENQTFAHGQPEISSLSSYQAHDLDKKQPGCHRYPLTSQSSVFENDCHQSCLFDKSMFLNYTALGDSSDEIYTSIPASCLNELFTLQNEMSNALTEVQSNGNLWKNNLTITGSSQRSKSLGDLETKESASFSTTKNFAARLKQITARIGQLTAEAHIRGRREDISDWRYSSQGDDLIDELKEIKSEALKSGEGTKRLQPIEEASPDAQDTCLLLFMHEEMTSYKKRLEAKHEQIKELCASKEDAVWKAVRETEEENAAIRKELYELRESHMRLKQDFHTQTIIFNKLKGQIDNRNQFNQDMYLKMYEKGKNAAWIERQEQIEELIENSPSQVSSTELIQKLKQTEQELTRWQTLVRRESYEEGEYLKPQTESDATLKFMKDSMFHYLTNPDNAALHLRAMIRMLGFTDDEKNKIATARKKVKNK